MSSNLKRITTNDNIIYTFQTIAGSTIGDNGYENNTNLLSSLFNFPMGTTFYNNNLYVSDTDNHCIRKINLNTNTVSTIAGSTSQISGNADGNGVDNSLFFSPTKIIFFNKVLYVLDSNNYSIRKVVDFIQPDCTSVTGYTSVANNTNICQCATGYTGSFNYTDNIISGCNKIYPAQTGYIGQPGNYSCDTSKGYGGTVVYDPNSLSGCKPIPCTSTGYTGTAGSCVCISGYNGVITYTNGVLGGCDPIPCTSKGYTGTAGSCVCISGYNGVVTYTNKVLGGCTPVSYTLRTGYIVTQGNYTCDTSKSYSGTVAYGAIYVAVGQGSNSVAYSYDGISWTGLGTTIFNSIGYGVEYGNDLWVAVGQGTNSVAYSSDGISWTGLGTTIFTYGYCVSYGNNLWVAGGYGVKCLAWSNNGKSWSVLNNSIMISVYGIAYGNGTWVVAGEGANSLGYSNTGISWTGSGNTFFSKGLCAAYGNNIWVAGGNNGTIFVSYDGISWYASNSLIFSECRSVAYNTVNNVWVAGGVAGVGIHTLAYSTNSGITWTGLGKTIFSTIVNRVLYRNGSWYAVGSGTNTLASSSSGSSSWTPIKSSIFLNAYGMTYGNGLSGCTPKTYTLTTGYTGTAGNYTCDTSKGYEGTVAYGTILSGCRPKTYTLTTGYTGIAGNYTCDTSKGYEGTVVYNLNSLSGCTLLRTTTYSNSINFQSGSVQDRVGNNTIKSFIITNNETNINNFTINIKPMLNSQIQINKVTFSSNNRDLFTPVSSTTSSGSTISGTIETFRLSSSISIPSNVTVKIYFYIWSKLNTTLSYTVDVTI